VRLRVKHGVDGKEGRALIGNPAVRPAVNLLLELRLESQRAERKRARKLLRVLALNKTKPASEKRRPPE